MTFTQTWISSRFAAGLVFAGWLLSSTVASADHESYRYEGKCFGFHGEEHMIQSLVYMDHAASADCRQSEIRAASKARDEVYRAIREICSQDAKKTLYGAVRSLNRFVGSGDICHLDEAAERVQRVMVFERTVHSVEDAYSRPFPHAEHGARSGRPAGGRHAGYDLDRHNVYRFDLHEADAYHRHPTDRQDERFAWPLPGGRIRIGFSF